jgi:putative spermidine/putrescine transport system permease protein
MQRLNRTESPGRHDHLERMERIRAASLVSPATLLITVMFVLPLLLFIRFSFNQFVPGEFMKTAWTLENYIKFLSDPYYLKILFRTIAIAVASTVLALILAFPVAHFLARLRKRWKSILIIIVVFPLLLGNVIRAMGWIAVFSQAGLMNQLLQRFGAISSPLQILQTPFAVTIVLAAVVMPYMILTLQAVLEKIQPDLEEAARDLGASAWQVFRLVILPLAMPGILAGTLLVFVLCMNAYATPILIGGPKVLMMAPALYSQIQDVSNWPLGAAMAVVLIAVTLATSAFYSHILSRSRYYRSIEGGTQA